MWGGSNSRRDKGGGGTEGREKQSVSEKESGPKQLSHALAADAAATKPVARHGEVEGGCGAGS